MTINIPLNDNIQKFSIHTCNHFYNIVNNKKNN